MPHEFGKCMRELRREGAPTGYTEVLAFLDKWIWPRSTQMDLRNIFHAKANTSNLEAQFFSCRASELLTIAPVLNLFFATIVAPQAASASQIASACVTSSCACLDVVELLVATKNVTVHPALLRDAVARHATARRAAYGTDIDDNSMKMHMAQHLPGMLEDVGELFSCWVQGRHHRLLTKYAGPRRNTASYERGVMREHYSRTVPRLRAALAGHRARRTIPAETSNETKIRRTWLRRLRWPRGRSCVQVPLWKSHNRRRCWAPRWRRRRLFQLGCFGRRQSRSWRGRVVPPLVWLGEGEACDHDHVGVRARDDPMWAYVAHARNVPWHVAPRHACHRGNLCVLTGLAIERRCDRDRAAEVALRRRNRCCGCFGRIGDARLFQLGCFGRIGGARLCKLGCFGRIGDAGLFRPQRGRNDLDCLFMPR